MKIKFNSDDNLHLNKTINIIHKFFLDEWLSQLQMLQYDGIHV